ncbi:uncharacterized protein LOC131803689 [Musca domestica]|uniref:Uncharacterized protein LOC131803689 n=1 Tax=Musca domestica TaxID=7370 RepID=A0ABM3V633_MUSDO|nr:uncharacterized protein LOC131803689 [Musca domestica]
MAQFEKKCIRKTPNKWSIISERALLEVWGLFMSQLRGCRKNSHILQEMASELGKHGFLYTSHEIKTKMHNMAARFRKEKRLVGTTGGSPSDWELYKEMEMLLAPCKTYNTEFLVLDSVNDIDAILTCEMSNSPPSSPIIPSSSSQLPIDLSSELPFTSSSKKRKREIEHAEKVERKIDILIEIEQRKEAIEEKKEALLRSFVEREAEVQKALVDFLRNA